MCTHGTQRTPFGSSIFGPPHSFSSSPEKHRLTVLPLFNHLEVQKYNPSNLLTQPTVGTNFHSRSTEFGRPFPFTRVNNNHQAMEKSPMPGDERRARSRYHCACPARAERIRSPTVILSHVRRPARPCPVSQRGNHLELSLDL